MYHSTLLLLLGSVCVYAATIPSEKVLYRRPGSQSVGSSRLGIYHGNSTDITKNPYLCGVLYYDAFLCAATIIDKSWVLLSGDCVYGVEPSVLNVVVGSSDGTTGKKYSVKQVIVHSKYPDVFLDYDYALIQIKGKFKWSSKVKKIALPKADVKPGTEVLVAGWGDTGSDGKLLEGKMTVISLKQCSDIYQGFGITFTDRMACVYNKGQTTLCDGDWSDPATKDNVLYTYFIAIATSGECSSSAYPAISANVYSAVPWIKNITRIA